MASTALQEAHLITRISNQTCQFSVVPDTREILQYAADFLNKEALRFVEFYNHLTISYNNTHLAQNNLVVPIFSEQEIHSFRVGAFISNCHKNYQIIENSDLLANKTIAVNVVNQEVNNISSLFIAAQNGHIEVVKLLLAFGADFDKPRNDGATPLFIATQNGHIEVVKLLLAFGADSDKPRNGGVTPLSIAVQQGHIEVVKLLLAFGADFDKPLDDGATPLFIAVYTKRIDVIKLLVKCGADPLKKSYNNQTPFYFAKHQGNAEIIKLLEPVVNGKVEYHKENCLSYLHDNAIGIIGDTVDNLHNEL